MKLEKFSLFLLFFLFLTTVNSQELETLKDELNKTTQEKREVERTASHSEGFELKEKAMDNILKLVSMQDMTKLSRD